MAKLSLETGVSKRPGDRGHDGTGRGRQGATTGVGVISSTSRNTVGSMLTQHLVFCRALRNGVENAVS